MFVCKMAGLIGDSAAECECFMRNGGAKCGCIGQLCMAETTVSVILKS